METGSEIEPKNALPTGDVLIVGWNKSANYGTCLQSLALYDAVSARYGCSVLWERRRLTPGAILRHFAVRHRSNGLVADELKRGRTDACFAAVDKTYINSRTEQRDALKRFKVFLVGGDQLWNPFLLEKTCLLDFVPSGFRKCSYGTSIGMARVPTSAARLYKKYLSRFDAVCMRDGAGGQAMAEIIGKPVQTVADPVFLRTVAGWTEFSEGAFDCGVRNGYALMYFVGERDAQGEYNRKRAVSLAAKRGHNAVLLPMDAIDYADAASLKGVGPREFVRLVAGADYIYTDSYHMTAFAIMFGKAFTVFKRFDGEGAYNPLARVDELLKTFGIAGGASADVVPQAEWSGLIADMRAKSLGVLYGAIEG